MNNKTYHAMGGTKLRNITTTGSHTDYAGNFVYEYEQSELPQLAYIIMPEGRIVFDAGAVQYEYHLKDHLGNTRVAFEALETGPEIAEVADYYPFGMLHEPSLAGSSNNKYLYNGKEIQEGTDWLDYGARMYDASLGRWFVIDPMAEKYNEICPYCYVANMPTIAVDPDGMRISIVGSEDYQKEIWHALLKLAYHSNKGAELVMNAINSDRTLVIADTKSEIGNALDDLNGTKDYEVLAFDLDKANEKYYDEKDGHNGEKLEKNVMTVMAHELSHFVSPQTGDLLTQDEKYSQGFTADEVNAVETENIVRAELGMKARTHYNGVYVYGKGLKESTKWPGNFILTDKENYAKHSKTNNNKYVFQNYRENSIGRSIEKRKTYYYNTRYLYKSLKTPLPSYQLLLYNKEK